MNGLTFFNKLIGMVCTLVLSGFLLGAQQVPLTAAHDLLAAALNQLSTNKAAWGTDDFANKLETIVKSFPDAPEATTARAMLIPYFMQKGDWTNASKLSDFVMADSPNSWQSAFASINKISILQSQGKGLESLQAASKSMLTIQSANLDAINDPDFKMFMESTGMKNFSFKDSALALSVNQLVKTGNVPEAATLISQIQDPTLQATLTKTLPSTVGTTASSALSTPPTGAGTTPAGH